MTKRIITAETVRLAWKAGQSAVVYAEGDIVTQQAQDDARRYGLSLTPEDSVVPEAASVPAATPAPAVQESEPLRPLRQRFRSLSASPHSSTSRRPRSAPSSLRPPPGSFRKCSRRSRRP